MHHLDTGKLGEQFALEYLKKKEYTILRQNFRAGKGEIDLIVRSPEGCLVFVEVKTRSLDGFGGPEEAVGRKKQDMISRTAGAFMVQSGYDGEIRFDLIAVLLQHGNLKQLRHAEDAFF
ncbi:MAG: YraN family protein [Bacteroidetes bacterium]|nr:MAG: YraN family protein [Bacteroidota bacterium]